MAKGSDTNDEAAKSSQPSQNGLATPSTITVVSHGDLVLHLSHKPTTSNVAPRFRVHSQSLRDRSKYFAGLLDGRFGEGGRMERAHMMLKQQYGSTFEKAPAEELPAINIEDVGRISRVKSIEALCLDLFRILHGLDLQAFPPVANLANLAVVADRFDALEEVRAYVRRKKLLKAMDAKVTTKQDDALTEERTRQRVLVSILLDYGPWLEKYSQRIITRRWTDREALDTDALWWDLPGRLEEELTLRRDCTLETIQSLQAHFVQLYSSRERQCRLGYDSSAQCDIFQLGQAIRFLCRIGTLRMQGTIVGTDVAGPFQDDIYGLIDSLRQIPEYQIDSYHSHCGVRTKLLPLLELISEALQHVGVCADCWFGGRADSWIEAKRPLVWRRNTHRLRGLGHIDVHANVRALFTANERDWNA